MLAIAQKLEALSKLYSQRDNLAAEKRSLIAGVLTPELLARLDEIDAEYVTKEEAAAKAIQSLETEIKTDTLAHGESVKGPGLQAVWTKGRITWDGQGLASYAGAHPDVLAYRKEGEPTVTIRRVQAKEPA